MSRLVKISVCGLCLFLLMMIVSSNATRTSAASVLYVTKGGYDGYECLTPATACGTINGALVRAAPGDTIKVTAEVFYGFGEGVVFIDKDITLSGGWDLTYTNPFGRTTLDGQGLRQGIEIVAAAHVSMDSFVVQNGKSEPYAGGIVNWGTLEIINCIIQNNHYTDPYAGGIFSYGPLTVLKSTIRKNIGPGIYSLYGPLTVIDSTINDNSSGVGVWIYNQNASIVNSTISGNENPGYSYNGGGIEYGGTGDQALLLRNVTITLNQTTNSGGGIYMSDLNGGQVLLANSILAGNTAASIGPDCYGPVDSQGYNIIGDTSGCTISSTIGDQLDVNPQIGPLRYNGGLTATHRLIAESSAIDGANPEGCQDQTGNPLTTDQRGFPRPLDGNGDGIPVCDVGAYEYDPLQILLSSFLPLANR